MLYVTQGDAAKAIKSGKLDLDKTVCVPRVVLGWCLRVAPLRCRNMRPPQESLQQLCVPPSPEDGAATASKLVKLVKGTDSQAGLQ